MKKNIITIFAIALSFGAFAQQNDTMFIHMGQTILEIPTKDVDSITFYRTQPPSLSPAGVSACNNCPQPCWEVSLDTVSFVSSALLGDSYCITDDCVSCGACQPECPFEAISSNWGGDKYVINQEICVNCAQCVDACPVNAIIVCDSGGGGGFGLTCDNVCTCHSGRFGRCWSLFRISPPGANPMRTECRFTGEHDKRCCCR